MSILDHSKPKYILSGIGQCGYWRTFKNYFRSKAKKDGSRFKNTNVIKDTQEHEEASLPTIITKKWRDKDFITK